MKISIKREQNGACISSAEREKFGAKLKTTKFFLMAALALTFAACSTDDNDIAQQPAKSNGIPFSATISIGNSATRAITENGTALETSWAVGDKVALIHNGVSNEMTVSSVDGGVATITGTITGSSGGDAVTIIYPSDAADDATGNVKSDWLEAQNGTLTGTGGTSIAEKYDVRTGSGTLNGDGTSLSGTASLTNQNAIFKLTLKDIDGTNDVSAESVVISDQSGTVTTVTPASATHEMYVALPTTATTLKFLVNGSDSKKYFNMASGLSLGANYYQSTVKLATVGDVILPTGKCAKAGTAGAVAMIAYLGDGDDNTTYNSGLAIALADANGGSCCAWAGTSGSAGVSTSGTMNDHKAYLNGIADTQTLISKYGAGYAAAKAAAYSVAGFTPADCGCSGWFLPSSGQWLKFFEAAGVNVAGWNSWSYAPGGYANWTNVSNLMETAASGSSVKMDWYWSSSEYGDFDAVGVYFDSSYGVSLDYYNKFGAYSYVRSFLAF